MLSSWLLILPIIVKQNLVTSATCSVNVTVLYYNCALITIAALLIVLRSTLTILFLLRIPLIRPFLVLLVRAF